MLISEVKSEILKEKRTANYYLLVIVPVLFIIFSVLMNLLMGPSPSNKSNFIAAAFNWYPLIILPSVITLFVCNILNKEKSTNIIFNRMHDDRLIYFYLAKNITILIESFIVIFISSFLAFIICQFLNQFVMFNQLLMASVGLFIGSLSIITISFILKLYFNTVTVIVINFILTLIAPIITTSKYWFIYPWCFNLKLMASILKLNPNGTFLKASDKLAQNINTPISLFISIIFYLLLLLIYIYLLTIKNKREI